MDFGPYSGYFGSFPQVSAACDGLVGVFLHQNALEDEHERSVDVTSQNQSRP